MRGSVDLEQPQQVHVHTPSATNPSPAQTCPGYVVVGLVPAREPLPCCGLGFGWTLFIVGFLLCALPWYIGAILLCCAIHKKDPREKAGCIACLVVAIVATCLIVVGIVTLSK